MDTSHFQNFLTEATIADPETESPLGADCLYGLYVSWCFLQGIQPRSDSAFRAGMAQCGIKVHDSQLRMQGPAAADYILSSYPAAV